MAILSVSVDLDEVRCYHDIHGLEAPDDRRAHVIYHRVLERIGEFFEGLEIPATFFVVGRDLVECSTAGRTLKDLAAAGHELGNHTMDHPYDLTLMSQGQEAEQISQCAKVLEGLTGEKPVGFRAPGYNVHLGLLDEVAEQGYLYDSSVFPCPIYTMAKVAAMGAKKLKGAQSRSIVGDPRVLLASTEPYRMGRDGVWTKGGIVELPISVVTPARLPFIGTSLTMAGRMGAGVLARAASRERFVNLELHGIDFADGDGDGLSYLKRHQPDLKIPLVKKIRALEHAVRVLLEKDFHPMTLADAASKVMI